MSASTITAKAELGAKLGELFSSDTGRAAFARNPSEVLPEAGLPDTMTVYADTAETVHLVIPAIIDTHRIAEGDDAYLVELGRQALGACIYKDLPK